VQCQPRPAAHRHPVPLVVDTPPTRHALDFLDAPKRLTRLLDNRIFRLLMTPARATMRVASVAVQTFLRTVARVVGSEVIKDVIAFFKSPSGKKYVESQPVVLDEMVREMQLWSQDLAEYVMVRIRAEMQKRGFQLQ
jgi:hypothetical protein